MFVAGPVTFRRIAVGGSETKVVATASTSGMGPLSGSKCTVPLSKLKLR